MTTRRRRPLHAAVGVVALLLVAASPAFVTSAAARPYAPSGKPITGGDDAGGATALTPGVHTDTLAQGSTSFSGNGSVRYYAIGVRTGQTPYVAVTVAPPDDPPTDGQLGLDVSLSAQGASSSCASESRSDFASDDRLDPVTVVVTPGAIGRTDGCPAGNLVVRVERTGDALVNTRLAIELAYRLEPAASAADQRGPAATTQPTISTGLTGTPATLASGNNFTSAPLVGTGIYKDALTAGDTRIVRVHLDWGQRFAYAVTASARPEVDSEDAVQATSLVRNPLRQVAEQASGSRTTAYSVGNQDVTLSGSTAAPVRYRNRESDQDSVAAYADAGDYYLVLGSDVPEGDTTLRYPYTLQIRVFGAAEPAPACYGVTAGAAAGPVDDSGGTGVAVAVAAGAAVLVVVVLVVVVRSRRRSGLTTQVRTHT